MFYSRADWADQSDDENDPTALPQPTTTVNKDGTKTTISYRIDDSGRKVKVTRKTRTVVHKEKVNPAIAERRQWAKFGNEKGKSRGPQSDTTSVGENIQFRPSRDWKSVQAEEAKNGGGKSEEKSLKEQLKDKKVKCRICSGEHFTARCPYKDTMAPVDAEGAAVDPLAEDGDKPAAEGGLGTGGSSYVPPHLRKGGAGTGERMGGKYERDDLATLRVTNVSLHVHLHAVALLTLLPGFRDGRRTGSTRYVRALWSRYSSLPCQRQRIRTGEGFCFHFVRGPGGCGKGLREDGWLWLSAPYSPGGVRETDNLNSRFGLSWMKFQIESIGCVIYGIECIMNLLLGGESSTTAPSLRSFSHSRSRSPSLLTNLLPSA